MKKHKKIKKFKIDKNKNFKFARSYIIDRENLDPLDIVILSIITSFNRGCVVNPSIDYFCSLLSLSYDTVSDRLAKLEKLNYIKVKRTKWHRNEYEIVDFEKHLNKRGFVYIPTYILFAKDIPAYSKFVYFGFCVMAKLNNFVVKTVSEILDILKINKDTFYKYRTYLTKYDFVKCERNGIFRKYIVTAKKCLGSKKNEYEKEVAHENINEYEKEVAHENINEYEKEVAHENINEHKKMTDSKYDFVWTTESGRSNTSDRIQSNNKKIYNNIIYYNNNISNNISIKSKKSSKNKELILQELDTLYEKNKDKYFRNTIINFKNMIKIKKTLNLNGQYIEPKEIIEIIIDNNISLIKLINRVSENIKAEVFEKSFNGEVIKHIKAYYFSTIWNEIIEIIKNKKNDKEIIDLSTFYTFSYSKKIAELSYELNKFYEKNNRKPKEEERAIITCKAYINKFFNQFISSNKKNTYFKNSTEEKKLYEIELIVLFVQSLCKNIKEAELLIKAFSEMDSTLSYDKLLNNVIPKYGKLTKLEIEIANNYLEPMHYHLKEKQTLDDFIYYLQEKFDKSDFTVRNTNNFYEFLCNRLIFAF